MLSTFSYLALYLYRCYNYENNKLHIKNLRLSICTNLASLQFIFIIFSIHEIKFIYLLHNVYELHSMGQMYIN